MNEGIQIGIAQLADQGKLGPLLMEVYGPVLEKENRAARAAAFPSSSVEDELMAADDFYFSTVDLMDCCFLARADGKIVGAACVNPYVSEVQYVAVLPAYRRRGVASALIGAALRELGKRGSDHARIDSPPALADEGGRALMAKLGFAEIRTAVVFGKALSV